MYPYMNEDAAWQRLKDVQREMENSRRWAAGERPDWFRSAVQLTASLARLLAGRSGPARGESDVCDTSDAEAVSDAA
jgi:hypothetical protein